MSTVADILRIISFDRFRGDWGAQIGVAELRLLQLPRGLHLRLPVFMTAAGAIDCGMPCVAGVAPFARYSGLYFTSEVDRAAFITALHAALRAVAPEIFERESRS
jgi:hypothetical protein